MLSIYLKTDDWYEMDFDEFNVAMNDTIQNIYNPVKMNTEYSKTISLPLTAKNREIIQHYNRLDSLVTTAFDATKAIPARLEVDGNIVFEGSYAVSKIDLSRNRIEGNFYSTVNTWINKLKRLTWDDLPNCLPDDFSIDKDKIYESWKAIPANRSINFNPPSDVRHYKWTDWIGFAPVMNGEMTDFSCDAMLKSNVEAGAATYHPWEVWTFPGVNALQPPASSATAIELLKKIIPKPTERQMMQFRSYYQKPYIYVDMLFQLIQDYCNNHHDEMPNMEWDDSWISESNPNWRNLIYFLPNILKTDEKPLNANAVYVLNNPISYNQTGFNIPQNQQNTVKIMTSAPLALTTNGDPEHTIIDEDGWIIGNGKTIDYILPVTCTANFSFTAYQYNDEAGLYGWNRKMNLVGAFVVEAFLKDNNGNEIPDSAKTIYSLANNGWAPPSFATNVTSTNNHGTITYNISWSLSGSGVYSHSFTATANTKYKPCFRWKFQNGMAQWDHDTYSHYDWVLFAPNISGMDQFDYPQLQAMLIPAWKVRNSISFTTTSENTPTDIHKVRYSEAGRSGRQLTMKDLWSKEENNTPFMVLLKYIKMFNLTIVYDSSSDTVKIEPKETFFADGYSQGIEDWTSKVDFGKEMSFKPLAWENKYVEFNYADSDLSKIKSFKEKYGFNYGTKRIQTSYSFNNETKKLLEGGDEINTSAEMSEYMYNMYQLNRIAANYLSPTSPEEAFLVKEAYMINNKDNKMADFNNCFAYRWDENTNWDINVNRLANGTYSSYIFITDDCRFENNNGTYCYQPVLSGNITWHFVENGKSTCDENYCNAIRTGYHSVGMPRISHYITKTVYAGGVTSETDYCCLFSVPREDYFNPNVVVRNDKDLWTTRWSNLITEMYSEQNKLLTCYIYLTPSDYNNFKFNKFIIIDDVLYLMNKICDYNPASLEATKCELIQVNDPGKYTTAPVNMVRRSGNTWWNWGTGGKGNTGANVLYVDPNPKQEYNSQTDPMST